MDPPYWIIYRNKKITMGQSSSKKDFKLDNSKGIWKQAESIKKTTTESSPTSSGIFGSRTSSGLETKPVPSVVIDDNSVAMTTNQPRSNYEVVFLPFLSYRFRLCPPHPYLFHFYVCILLRPDRLITTLDRSLLKWRLIVAWHMYMK